MRQKRPLSPVEELRVEKLEKLEKCFAELETYKKNKLTKIMGVRLQYSINTLLKVEI